MRTSNNKLKMGKMSSEFEVSKNCSLLWMKTGILDISCVTEIITGYPLFVLSFIFSTGKFPARPLAS